MLKKSLLLYLNIAFLSLIFTFFAGAKIDKANVIGVWLFDKDNDASDASGKGHNGKADGNVKWVKGKFGSAIDIDGNSAMVFEHKNDLSLQSFTLVAWVNIPKAPTDWWTVVAKDGWPNRNYGIWLASGTALAHSSFTSGAGPANNAVNAKTPVKVGEWQHLAATYDLKVSKVYINGELDNEANFTDKPNVTDVPVIIGRTPSGTYKLTGSVDEVAIFNVALSADDIKTIMVGGLRNTVTAVFPKAKLVETWGNIKFR